jgi:hypothetical protein
VPVIASAGRRKLRFEGFAETRTTLILSQFIPGVNGVKDWAKGLTLKKK